MTIKELMERAGMTQTGLAVAYIKDGMDEIARYIDDNIVDETQNITKGTRDYSLPTGMIRLRKVQVKNDQGNFQDVPRLTHGPAEEK
tara:strand:+ start:58 stop:318 length:261 start_codon:yes stop_codon:yes gene_type:complete